MYVLRIEFNIEAIDDPMARARAKEILSRLEGLQMDSVKIQKRVPGKQPKGLSIPSSLWKLE